MGSTYDRQTPDNNMCSNRDSRWILGPIYNKDNSEHSSRAGRQSDLQKPKSRQSSKSFCQPAMPEPVTYLAKGVFSDALLAGR
jgi:hypothetical protein